MPQFDKAYWEERWSPRARQSTGGHATEPQPEGTNQLDLPVNPYLDSELRHLPVGTALDAGCGTGVDALWLAEKGWQVTGADISAAALAVAARRASDVALARQVEWVEADLSSWKPNIAFDLVVTSYAHAQIGQLAFYQRIAAWVALGGTLLIVGHAHAHTHRHPAGANAAEHPPGTTATTTEIAALLRAPQWRIDASYDSTRTAHVASSPTQLHDVVVRAHRNP